MPIDKRFISATLPNWVTVFYIPLPEDHPLIKPSDILKIQKGMNEDIEKLPEFLIKKMEEL